MSRRLLVIEPDPRGRSMMDRALASEGYAVRAVGSLEEAELGLNGYELALVDERGSAGSSLREVRALRSLYPKLQLIVTGSLLSPGVLRELLRLGVADALPKPFTPGELRTSVARAIHRSTLGHEDALEFAAAQDGARAAIVDVRFADAKSCLGRAVGASPFDAETMSLMSLVAELEGRDEEADRGYRAALALRHDEETGQPDPFEGLARLAVYEGAVPVRSLTPAIRARPVWLVTDPMHELGADPPIPIDVPQAIIFALGLTVRPDAPVFFREGRGARVFVLLTASARPDAIAAALRMLGGGDIVALEPTKSVVELDRVRDLTLRGSPADAADRAGLGVSSNTPGVWGRLRPHRD